MPVADYIAIAVVLIVLAWLVAVVVRQRRLVRRAGGIQVAVRGRGTRWRYGVGRYAGEELQWFGVFGVGRRPSRSLQRTELQVIGRHQVSADDRAALPANAVIIELRDSSGPITLGLGEGAYTGFVSWLEASAPQ